MEQRFLIESALPIQYLSKEARREKAIRHGHISTLHVWWARRPLVVARAAVLGALLPESDDVTQEFITNLCKWGVHDGDSAGRYLLEQARALVRKRFPDSRPKVLDSFAGGGSIPLEALRLGCEAYAGEYNPVAYLILKATIEYPQRYGHKLVEAVKRWGEWVLEQARKELAEFYPKVNSETPIAYIWSRTIRCPNPSCGAEIQLFRQFWLARKANKRVALKPLVDRQAKRVEFTVVQDRKLDFDPSEGTVRRANAVCLLCGSAAKDKYVKAEAQAGRMGHRLVAVVTTRGRGQGRNYRLATDVDLAAFQKAEEALQKLLQTPSPWAFGLSWVPEEPMDQHNPNIVSGRGYGFQKWYELFNPRQLLALCTFGKWVRAAHQEILRETGDAEFAKAVGTYLGLAMGNVENYNGLLSGWDNRAETMWNTFSGHNLHMQWSYAEANTVAGASGSWQASLERIMTVCQRESHTPEIGSAHLGSATSLTFAADTFDAVVIDPPYADNVPYADLSDFFYVWLRRAVGDLYPEAFQTELTPKDEEAVVNPARFGGGKRGEQIAEAHYRRLMQQSFKEIYRVLKPEGICVVMFTHRSTAAWERLIQSLLDAGLYPTASWPVHTEMEASTHQRGKGAVQSTILMTCRRRSPEAPTGWYHEVRGELREVVRERLMQFWDAGIRGADFFISAIGPAVGVFGRYRKVLRPDGREVGVEELLDEVRTLVANYALERLGQGLGLVDAPTRLYVLYRWAYGDQTLSFDEANKLAKSLGAELDRLSTEQRLVSRKGDQVTLPTFWERLRDENSLRPLRKALEDGQVHTLPLIDVLHLALFFWKRGETEGLTSFLALGGFHDEDHAFWRAAQALYESEREWEKSGLSDEVTALGQLLPARTTLTKQAMRAIEERRQLSLPI